MKESDVIMGNDEICKAMGWESNKAYVYKVPNTFPFEKEVDTGWTEWECSAVGFETDWNMLIGAYNRVLEILNSLNETQKEMLNSHKHFIQKFAVNHVIRLSINGKLEINPCWRNVVDFCQWYNGIKSITTKPKP